jgi:hypothetical protein
MAGLYYEELTVGRVFQHSTRRTVTEMDNIMFSALTHNPAPLHIDEEYCRNANFRDSEALASEVRISRRDGFNAKFAIHPDQVAVINAGFLPDERDVERARHRRGIQRVERCRDDPTRWNDAGQTAPYPGIADP